MFIPLFTTFYDGFYTPQVVSRMSEPSTVSPENQWLEDGISFRDGPFSGVMVVFWGGGYVQIPWDLLPPLRKWWFLLDDDYL